MHIEHHPQPVIAKMLAQGYSKECAITQAAKFNEVARLRREALKRSCKANGGTGMTRGGPGRGQGRKPVKQGEETVTLSLRVTVAQREKLERLGGAEWVRGKDRQGQGT